jgi:D-sedoheptulose 7-phosphate isomerase
MLWTAARYVLYTIGTSGWNRYHDVMPVPPITTTSSNEIFMKHLLRNQLQQTISTVTLAMEDELLADSVIRAAQITSDAMKRGNKLLVAGNGGSAADAQHLVAEFVSRLTVDRPALPAIALTTDTSILTAIGNDYAYENVFERQIEAIGCAGDVFLGISTSGNAKNLLKALRICVGKGIQTIGYIGNEGGAMKSLCDIAVIVPSKVTMHIQECQLALEHIFCMMVERFYFGPEFGQLPQKLSE